MSLSPRFPFSYFLFPLAFLLLLNSCKTEESSPSTETRFRTLSTQESGISFSNTLTDEVIFNILNYPYFYNGGGVAAGDINGDGLPDLFFTSNQGQNRLYLNQGDLSFKDITEEAGISSTQNWSTGVTLVDINADGWLDIYVNCVSGLLDRKGHNELYINQSDGTFTEEAEKWGLALEGYGTQATFFDYDGDGDLDMFQLNHSIKPAETIGPISQREEKDPLAGDRLFRNEGEKFVEVTEEAGIISSRLGYGLNVLTGDLNRDGWPDLYVCNDFHEDDYLYLNQGDGTFRESLREWAGHTSKFSMGGDMADINNDGLADLMTLDMKPDVEAIRKTAQPPESYDRFQYKLNFGYHYQYAHNALQLNRGNGTFSEVAQLAGVDATDWSWSVLFADFDNDGARDLFITNGIYRRPDDMDYISFISDPFITRQLNGEPSKEELTFIERMPSIAQPNYLYHNLGNLEFESVGEAWGLGEKGFTNGAAYADLDGDGDLDLVLNNLNAPAQILENQSDSTNKTLSLILEGSQENSNAIGTRIEVQVGTRRMLYEHYPTRGFQSSSLPSIINLGVGETERVDSLFISWPDGKKQVLWNLLTNETHIFYAGDGVSPSSSKSPKGIFAAVTSLDLGFTHEENSFIDLNREPLMPHLLSTQGPRIAIGDVGNRGIQDIYYPNASGTSGQLFLGMGWGIYSPGKQIGFFKQYAEAEEVEAEFFDADGDEDLDLYVAYGGNEFPADDPRVQDRLFLNKGNGTYEDGTNRLPAMPSHSSCVSPADYDGDGDIDLFVGGRSLPGSYGISPYSYLLINDGKGDFSDQTVQLAPDLQRAGMLTDAVWMDVNTDGKLDLVVAGEWMPITAFVQGVNGKLTRSDEVFGSGLSGWWNRLYAADLDGDGDQDLVAGNLGLNSTLQASEQEPCALYVADFDGNGATDPILCSYRNGVSYPWAMRDDLLKQVVSFRRKFQTYADYAEVTIEELLTPEQLADAQKLEVQTFAHVWLEQKEGEWVVHELPRIAQISPVYAMLADDWNGDGHMDLLIAGNFFGVGPNRGRYDAGQGLLMLGDSKGNWTPLSPQESGISLRGEVRDLQPIMIEGKKKILVAQNNGPLQVLEMSER